jgi:hypothetical protein
VGFIRDGFLLIVEVPQPTTNVVSGETFSLTPNDVDKDYIYRLGLIVFDPLFLGNKPKVGSRTVTTVIFIFIPNLIQYQ